MISFLIHNPLQPLPNRTKHIPHKQTELLYVLYATSNLHLLKFGVEWYHPINSRILIFKTIIMWSITCLIPLEIRIRHIFKKSVLYDVKPCFLHLSILSAEIWKKSLAFRQRTKLSTQPFIYRISVSGKLSTRPFIYHISVSGKLSLYLHTSKNKAESQ